ncbi:hypothetical protein, partial [Vibrio atlanticus]|uniref:hypothetical protein n=3 Tax=Vibrionaceae TaxID=641 RepID=UPI00354D33A8
IPNPRVGSSNLSTPAIFKVHYLCMKKGHSLSGLFAICDLFYRRLFRFFVMLFAFTTRPPLAKRYPFFNVPFLLTPALVIILTF